MPDIDSDRVALNTDRELWRRIPGDFYSPSLHITQSGGIGMDVGGHVIVLPIEAWHAAATTFFDFLAERREWQSLGAENPEGLRVTMEGWLGKLNEAMKMRKEVMKHHNENCSCGEEWS